MEAHRELRKLVAIKLLRVLLCRFLILCISNHNGVVFDGLQKVILGAGSDPHVMVISRFKVYLAWVVNSNQMEGLAL